MGDDADGSTHGPDPTGRPDVWARLTATDRAILVAFTRPYVTGQRFASPAPNNKILKELGQAGLHMDLDTLRSHLRNLYAKFGVEDGLTPAQKRVRLVELVYEHRVIPGWNPIDPAETVSPPGEPLRPDAAAGAGAQANPSGALPEPNTQPPRPEPAPPPGDRDGPRVGPAAWLRRRPWVPAGLAAAILGLLAWAIAGGAGEGSQRPAPTPPAGKGIDSATKVIDVDAIRNARGRVNFCTGKDVAKSSDGTTYQHQKSVEDFNARFGPDLHANLIQFSDQASLQYKRFARDQRKHEDNCDVFYSDVVWTADFAHEGWLYDLSPYVRPRLDRYVAGMRAAARFENRLWGVPKQADAGLLYYNTTSVDDPPKTWPELYALAAKGKQNRFRTQALASEALTVTFLELAYAAGATAIVTPDRKADIDQNAALEALQLMVAGIKTKAIPPNIVNQAEEKSLHAFGDKRADLMRNWPYVYAQLNDPRAYPKVAGDVAVAPLPTWDHGPQGVLGGHLLVISAFSKNPGAALKLVDFLSSAPVVKQDAIEFGLAPALVALYDDPDVQESLPAFVHLKDAIANARSRPVTPNYQSVSEAIFENVNAALQGSLTPREALKTANEEMQQALDDAYRSP